PVAAADHVPRPSRRHGDTEILQKTASIARGHQLRRALAHRVHIVPAERIVLTVGVRRLAIFVTFIASYDDGRTGPLLQPQSFEDVRGAEHVGLDGQDRLLIRLPHERLRREMKDVLRLALAQHLANGGKIAQVALDVTDGLADPRGLEQRGRRVRRQRKTGYLSAQLAQPERQPPTLETGVASEQDPLAAIRVYQVFHGAWPLLHASLSMAYSRAVS